MRHSNSYASRDGRCCVLLLSRLLVSDAVHIMPNDSSLRFPPGKPGSRMRYNTVTGVTGERKVCIVYENGRAYPKFRVVYKA
jgi:hypothetical protein